MPPSKYESTVPWLRSAGQPVRSARHLPGHVMRCIIHRNRSRTVITANHTDCNLFARFEHDVAGLAEGEASVIVGDEDLCRLSGTRGDWADGVAK